MPKDTSGAEALVGMRGLESKETPGLGDKIMTDEAFLKNFEKLDMKLSADGASLAHAVIAVKQGGKTDPWQVDGITGATISSNAIANILNESASFWLPRIRENLDAFEGGR